MFDITKVATSDTSLLHLRGPEDELLFDADKNPVQVELYGPGSRPYVQAQTKRANRSVQRLQKKGKFEMSSDEQITEQAEFLTAITARFINLSYPPAGDAQGSDLAKAVYSDPKIGFIAEQVSKHAGEWGNFTSSSATS
jgi:hypothetical protein